MSAETSEYKASVEFGKQFLELAKVNLQGVLRPRQSVEIMRPMSGDPAEFGLYDDNGKESSHTIDRLLISKQNNKSNEFYVNYSRFLAADPLKIVLDYSHLFQELRYNHKDWDLSYKSQDTPRSEIGFNLGKTVSKKDLEVSADEISRLNMFVNLYIWHANKNNQ